MKEEVRAVENNKNNKKLKYIITLYLCFVLTQLIMLTASAAFADQGDNTSEVLLEIPSKQYTVTVNCKGNGNYGAYTRSDLAGEQTGTKHIEYSAPHKGITIHALPKRGYKATITAVYQDGTRKTSATNEFLVEYLQQDVTIDITFDQLQPYSIIASVRSGKGTISPNGTTTVYQGETQKFEFTPANGYQISAVYVDNNQVATSATYTFTNISANHKIEVSFTEDQGSNNNNSGSSENGGKNSLFPKTGDESNAALYTAAALISLIMFILILKKYIRINTERS